MPSLAWIVAVVVAIGAGFALLALTSPDAAAAASRGPRLEGSIDLVEGTPGSVRVAGWALDPLGSGGVGVAVAVDRSWTLVPAQNLRPDIWRFFPRSGPFHGFDVRLAASPGPHLVCVVAAGGRLPQRPLGCRLVSAGPPPVGVIDTAEVLAADEVTLSGWALFPAATDAVELKATVDGSVAATAVAATSRPDLAAVFPAAGADHGFRLAVPAAPGRHEICVTASVAGGAALHRLDCRTVDVPVTQPRGSLDSVRIDGADLVVEGWADDPDTAGSIDVRVTASRDQVGDPAVTVTVADRPRPDVAAFLGVDARRGYSARITGVAAGTRTFCAVAVNQHLGNDRIVGCRTVNVADSRPVGSLDTISPVPGGVRVRGWFADPDTRAPVTVVVTVDGSPHSVPATGSRPDVAGAYPAFGDAVGFDVTIDGLANGVHDVCVSAPDVVAGAGLVGTRVLPCGGVVSTSTYSVATTGAVASGGTVGPPPGNPLTRIDRDAGVTAMLRDGSTLWLFGDSMERAGDGSLRYFINNTAAWAPPGSAGVTLDAVVGGQPVQFASPTDAFPTCTRPTDTRAMWPTSAVVIADGPVDRVLVYLTNICMGRGQPTEAHGVALAEWVYEPGSGGNGQPIVATVLNQRLFSDFHEAEAAVIGTDGRIYAYACDGPEQGGWPTEYGPCTISRVAPSDAAVAASYRYWNGSAWVAGKSSAAPVVMPDGRDGVTNLPPGGVNVVHDATSGLYVMGYSPWPGYTNQMALRFATAPQGPFSAPLVLSVADCNDTAGGTRYLCYAAGVQPRFSQPGRLGVGWYDQLVAITPLRGAYTAGSVPLEIVRW